MRSPQTDRRHWKHGATRAVRVLPGSARAESWLRTRLLSNDLRRLHDVLATTPLTGHYWTFGGFLLGWARDGALLRHDLNDVDFAYESHDDERFLAAVPALVEAGFRRLFRYRNNEGTTTEHSFFRRGAKFDFFRMDRRDDRLRYYVYGTDPEPPGGHVELTCELPAQELAPFEFLGRRWLKPADHDATLTAAYGNWRVPDPTWSFLDDRSIVQRRPWSALDYSWDER